MIDTSESMLRSARRATLAAVAIFSVTTVHHVYGAIIYSTPWRLHAVIISGLATALVAGSLTLFRKHSSDALGTFAYWSFTSITLLIPFLSFGLFEGAYNHGLKDLLYLAHTSPAFMQRLFPPPMYEMPNNWFFEITGLMHIVPGYLTGYYIFRVAQARSRLRKIAFQSI